MFKQAFQPKYLNLNLLITLIRVINNLTDFKFNFLSRMDIYHLHDVLTILKDVLIHWVPQIYTWTQ